MTTFKIKYRYSKDYRTIPASGSMVSITPQGLIQCELYIEKADILSEFDLEVDESGKPHEPEREVNAFIREAQISAVMTSDMARSLGQLLISKADEITQIMEERGRD